MPCLCWSEGDHIFPFYKFVGNAVGGEDHLVVAAVNAFGGGVDHPFYRNPRLHGDIWVSAGGKGTGYDLSTVHKFGSSASSEAAPEPAARGNISGNQAARTHKEQKGSPE